MSAMESGGNVISASWASSIDSPGHRSARTRATPGFAPARSACRFIGASPGGKRAVTIEAMFAARQFNRNIAAVPRIGGSECAAIIKKTTG
ncbi:MAG: hypothetical protein EPN34_09830 [Burkholderiaceae bacterium]|jgi:hypothetical protein|nr:MAG: hypothetical protein EPN34_09830 [Burkholderiaceae bacterium]